ncbi:hypothetical protein [Marinobacterium arenosum]|uniref:hypothetical protein n=1 Tax=Marinobacterium arenosum TaxID=2862496 RepID=UPI001C98420F|nr:hypothetical protein [Marinobacterium arenosum]MBY4675900.1 hypothetical protein [Marinobacterium arenosum]
MRLLRNSTAFALGLLLAVASSLLLIPSAHAVEDQVFRDEVAIISEETNSIIVQSTLGLAYCLGWVAGSFR